MNILERIKKESKSKLIIAGLVLAGVAYALVINPYDKEYMAQVETELALARKICENSRDFVMRYPNRLKLDVNVLENIKVDGKIIKLEHIAYPEVLYFSSGFRHRNAGNELYCSFSDPRTSSVEFFYDYKRDQWVPRTRSRL